MKASARNSWAVTVLFAGASLCVSLLAQAQAPYRYDAATVSGLPARNIGSATIIGDSTQSEIKTGYNVTANLQGIQPTQGSSKIGATRVRGDLVDSVISASYRPGALGYGSPGSVAGPGSITGTFDGHVYFVGNTTALGNLGSGFYAKKKSPGLP